MNDGTKWETIARDIRAEIEAGRKQPGDPAPSELALSAAYHVARGTAREALRHLEQAGVLSPGSPRTVARRERITVSLTRDAEQVGDGESPTRGADAFLGGAAAAGREPEQEIMVIIAQAPPDVARRLGLPAGAPVIARQLVRSAGGSRHNMITFWFSDEVARGTPLAEPGSIEEGSLTWLEKHYGALTQAPATIGTRMPEPAEADVLGILTGVPVMVVWRTTLMRGGLPVVTSMSLWPGDRTILRLDL